MISNVSEKEAVSVYQGGACGEVSGREIGHASQGLMALSLPARRPVLSQVIGLTILEGHDWLAVGTDPRCKTRRVQ